MTSLHAVPPTIFPQLSSISRERRARMNGHRGAVLLLTGLSGSGKSSVAHVVEEHLFEAGHQVVIVDGDNLRSGLCSDLTFDAAGRTENLRRAGEMLTIFAEAGAIVLATFIAPVAADRASIRKRLGDTRFVEIFCDCPATICEQRDVKGLYKRARSGGIAHFTGVSAGYEPPLAPDLHLPTDRGSVDAAAAAVIRYLGDAGMLRMDPPRAAAALSQFG